MTIIPEPVRTWCLEHDYGEVVSAHPVGGGCINNGARLQTASNRTFFLKTNLQTPADMFAREAEGLEELRVADGPRVPRPYLHGPGFLLLEDLSPGPRGPDYWADFGHKLAALHNHTRSQFGFYHDNYIGSTPQPNAWTEDGFVFFAEQRLNYQAHLAGERGLLDREAMRGVEAISARLKGWIPKQPASLIHGDLWSGNAISDSEGSPALIDPAAHYGWAEAELAMTSLFGSFPETFYRAYQEYHPLEKGFRERFPLYNLYHLLNHLNLFGGSYLGQVLSIVRRFG